MATILISIKPKYAKEILYGNKKYEYRRIKPKKDIDKMIIYASSPIKEIVGEVEVLEILEDTKENIWETTNEFGCITKEDFDLYYKDKKMAIAFKLGKVKTYKKDLKDLINFVPQSFIYID